MKKKGQAGIEAIMAMGILAVVLAVVYLIYTAKSEDLRQSKDYLLERGECLTLAAAIGNMFILGNSAEMNLPLKHLFTISPAAQHIESLHAFCTLPVPIVGTNGKNPFNVTGKIQLENRGGIVQITSP